jgi:hypothetical protein
MSQGLINDMIDGRKKARSCGVIFPAGGGRFFVAIIGVERLRSFPG